MQFSKKKTSFLKTQNFAKTLFWHTVTLFVLQKKPKKHYKTGEKTAKKNLDQFLTYNLDQFLTYKTPNLGPVFNFTAYIYIYIYDNRGSAFLKSKSSIFRHFEEKQGKREGKTTTRIGCPVLAEKRTFPPVESIIFAEKGRQKTRPRTTQHQSWDSCGIREAQTAWGSLALPCFVRLFQNRTLRRLNTITGSREPLRNDWHIPATPLWPECLWLVCQSW